MYVINVLDNIMKMMIYDIHAMVKKIITTTKIDPIKRILRSLTKTLDNSVLIIA